MNELNMITLGTGRRESKSDEGDDENDGTLKLDLVAELDHTARRPHAADCLPHDPCHETRKLCHPHRPCHSLHIFV